MGVTKYFYNSELAKIDSPEKAYLLGLYYADGFVSYDSEKYSYFSGEKCNHCNSTDIVESGYTRSRTDGEIIGKKFKCQNCKKVKSIKLSGR